MNRCSRPDGRRHLVLRQAAQAVGGETNANTRCDEGSATSLASYQLEVLRDKNRELNRRIEIILVPNLEELPSLTGDQP